MAYKVLVCFFLPKAANSKGMPLAGVEHVLEPVSEAIIRAAHDEICPTILFYKREETTGKHRHVCNVTGPLLLGALMASASPSSSPDNTIPRAGEAESEGLWRLTPQRLLAYKGPPPADSSDSGQKCCSLCGGSRKQVDKYNKDQDCMLKEFGKLDEFLIAEKLSPSATEAEIAATTKWETFAINISNLANFSIFAATVFVAAVSGSLAIVASALDSFLDLMSGLILWFTSVKMRKPNPHTYPIGKQRMQPVGILVFSTVMASLGLQIAIISIEKLITKEKQVDLEGHKGYLVIVIMGVSIVVMFALAIYCQTFKSKLVKAYADDHFFDGLTNVVGLASAILAAKFRWWIDPLGALLLAIYTILCWIGKIRKNIRLLVGKTATPEILQKITYVCWNFDKRIQKIDTVRAYSCGGEYVAEVDIVLPKEMQLGESHDIGEGLQNKLESLPFIERAFVHVDYEVSHRPEHSAKVCFAV
ncbi:hypothetical protein GOP47_0019610 [Adiantum capillus-veneris]|uniref:Cation efflux protein cytoplasmic domain-containing protein n=1 Tax=Adiantum capillus-veneris TaxID=13818 RepID=A0A9D4Z8M5_ADICA|nr:hypothetical protein GOP47_0019610 [Adiantum capillus-veneris]